MTVTNALAGVAVSDLEQAIAWYGRVLDRGPDQRPMTNEAEYGFKKGGWMQVFVDKSRAGKSSVTFVVDDINEEVARLRSAGLDVRDPDRSDFADTVIIHDPDGNQVVFAQAKSKSNAAAS